MSHSLGTWEDTAKEPEVQGYHWLHGKFKASQGYMRHHIKKKRERETVLNDICAMMY